MGKSIIKTVYIVLESWCNGTNNGIRELVSSIAFNSLEEARAHVAGIADGILKNGLGGEFRRLDGEVLCNDASKGCLVREGEDLVLMEDMLTFWYGKEGSERWGQDRYRRFDIEPVRIDVSALGK